MYYLYLLLIHKVVLWILSQIQLDHFLEKLSFTITYEYIMYNSLFIA